MPLLLFFAWMIGTVLPVLTAIQTRGIFVQKDMKEDPSCIMKRPGSL